MIKLHSVSETNKISIARSNCYEENSIKLFNDICMTKFAFNIWNYVLMPYSNETLLVENLMNKESLNI